MLVQTVKLMRDIAGDYVEFESDDAGFHRAWACSEIVDKYIPTFDVGEFEIYDQEIEGAIKIHLGKDDSGWKYLEVNDIRVMNSNWRSPLPEVTLFSKLGDLLREKKTIWVKYRIIEQ